METKYYKVIQVIEDVNKDKPRLQKFFLGDEVYLMYRQSFDQTIAHKGRIFKVSMNCGKPYYTTDNGFGSDGTGIYNTKQELFEALMNRLADLQDQIVQNFTKEVD